MDDTERVVIMLVEPSAMLSELCGFSYFIERRFTVKELLEKGIINENDIERMKQGEGIYKQVPVVKDR